MHTVIMQVHDGPQFKALLDYLQTVGIGRVVFPGREYRSKAERFARANDNSHEYDTVALLPRGNDGGFAERFLRERVIRC